MILAAHWSPYAILQAWKAATGRSPVVPTTFKARLYSDTADPASSPVELTVGGYVARTATFTLNDTAHTAANATDWDWTGIAAATVGGVAVTDDGTGQIMWYSSFTPIATAAGGGGGGGVIVPAGYFNFSLSAS